MSCGKENEQKTYFYCFGFFFITVPPYVALWQIKTSVEHDCSQFCFSVTLAFFIICKMFLLLI